MSKGTLIAAVVLASGLAAAPPALAQGEGFTPVPVITGCRGFMSGVGR